jgi:catechol 2,3-dioxygenase-like lactoylglutathione lyase family enzyme
MHTHGRFLRAICTAVMVVMVAAARVSAQIARAVQSVGMTVSDMDRSLAFYTSVLGFTKLSDVEIAGDAYEHLEGVFGARVRIVRLQLGDETIELTEYLTPRGRPIPVDAHSNDGAFQHIAIVVSDMSRAYATLRAHHVEHASTGPQRLPDWNPNAGGIEAFYFKDPDHHVLEVLHFPRGKGDPKWQRTTSATFLGIDHTAIVSGDTERSLAFYRDVLGMRIAGESENYGTEQEHLNNVFGARLRITSLRAASGPGIELLEYLSPRDGRSYPADEHANDIVHWQAVVRVGDADSAASALTRSRARFVSSAIVASRGERALLVRDPDGHALELVQLITTARDASQ